MTENVLAGLDGDERRLLLASMPRRAFRKGDTLFHEGDPGDTFHVIAKGRVAIRVSTPRGDVATLTVLGPSAGFGEQALLTADARRTASAVALEPVETRMLHRDRFDELRREHPSVERLLVQLLAAQVRRLSAQVVDALYTPADKRVVRRLADLVDVYEGNGAAVEIPIRQEDLASMAGTTRPTANKVLRELEDAGTVSIARGRLVVADPHELRRRAR